MLAMTIWQLHNDMKFDFIALAIWLGVMIFLLGLLIIHVGSK